MSNELYPSYTHFKDLGSWEYKMFLEKTEAVTDTISTKDTIVHITADEIDEISTLRGWFIQNESKVEEEIKTDSQYKATWDKLNKLHSKINMRAELINALQEFLSSPNKANTAIVLDVINNKELNKLNPKLRDVFPSDLVDVNKMNFDYSNMTLALPDYISKEQLSYMGHVLFSTAHAHDTLLSIIHGCHNYTSNLFKDEATNIINLQFFNADDYNSYQLQLIEKQIPKEHQDRHKVIFDDAFIKKDMSGLFEHFCAHASKHSPAQANELRKLWEIKKVLSPATETDDEKSMQEVFSVYNKSPNADCFILSLIIIQKCTNYNYKTGSSEKMNWIKNVIKHIGELFNNMEREILINFTVTSTIGLSHQNEYTDGLYKFSLSQLHSEITNKSIIDEKNALDATISLHSTHHSSATQDTTSVNTNKI